MAICVLVLFSAAVGVGNAHSKRNCLNLPAADCVLSAVRFAMHLVCGEAVTCTTSQRLCFLKTWGPGEAAAAQQHSLHTSCSCNDCCCQKASGAH
jgi:hypothetical protein